MRERQIKEALRTSSMDEVAQDRLLAQIRQNIAYGLRLDEGLGDFPVLRRATIVTLISETILTTSSILGVSFPIVSTFYPWQEREERSGQDMMEAVSEKGIVRYLPSFLYLVALAFEKKHDEAAKTSLVETTAHEMYHQFQYVKYPVTFARDREKDRFFRSKLLTDDLPFGQEWKSRSEESARKFGKRYAKHYLNRHSF